MPKHGLSQEKLKWIACVSMLLDHIGATIVLNCCNQLSGAEKAAMLQVYEMLRTVGRLAFPIYCFLLVEGFLYTSDLKRYGIRLLIGAVISEIPYDLALYGSFNWEHQNVMLTLLFGLLMLETMRCCRNLPLRLLTIIPFAILADVLNMDYGANGILVIALFALTRELRYRGVLQFLGLWFIFSPGHQMVFGWLNGTELTVQELAVLSIIPIELYTGMKRRNSKVTQLAFYLFYPVHLLVLYLIQSI